MTFDEQHGWVERGTRGIHSGAVVRDVEEEMHALYRLHIRAARESWWWPIPRSQRIGRLDELLPMLEARRATDIERLRDPEDRYERRAAARDSVACKLALLAPYIAILRAGDEKRRRRVYAGFDVGRGSATAYTTYAVEGDTLRIVHNVQLPARAQAVDVTMMIGGAT